MTSKLQHIPTATLLLISCILVIKSNHFQIIQAGKFGMYHMVNIRTSINPILSLPFLKIVLLYFITVNVVFEVLKGQHCKLGILYGMITPGSDIGVTYVEALILVCVTQGR